MPRLGSRVLHNEKLDGRQRTADPMKSLHGGLKILPLLLRSPVEVSVRKRGVRDPRAEKPVGLSVRPQILDELAPFTSHGSTFSSTKRTSRHFVPASSTRTASSTALCVRCM